MFSLLSLNLYLKKDIYLFYLVLYTSDYVYTCILHVNIMGPIYATLKIINVCIFIYLTIRNYVPKIKHFTFMYKITFALRQLVRKSRFKNPLNESMFIYMQHKYKNKGSLQYVCTLIIESFCILCLLL